MIAIMKKIKIIGLFNLLFLLAAGLCLPVNAQTSFPDAQDETVTKQEPKSRQSKSEKKANRINYFGIGGTVGLNDDGNTSLGNGGFSLVGRFSLTDNISTHTSSVFNDGSVLSIALTGGAPIRSRATGRTIIFPFAGAGVAVETDGFNVDPLVTGGIDIPFTNSVTGTTRVNASFADDGTDVGLIFGIGIRLFR